MEILELVFCTVIVQTSPVDIVATEVARNVSQSYFPYFPQTTCHATGVTAKLARHPDNLQTICTKHCFMCHTSQQHRSLDLSLDIWAGQLVTK